LFVTEKKYIKKKEKWERGGEESRLPDHKLNNTDDITSRIIQSVTSLVILSVKIPCHYIICLFESHCNTLHHSLGIYRENLSVDIFTNIFYHRVNYIGNVLCKSYTSLYCLTFFFIPYFPTAIPLVYTEGIFLSVFTNGYRDEKFYR
jgi:hypothetical protein